MNNEQPKVVGAGTSVNKKHWKSKAASNSSCIFLERDPCLRRATNSCNRTRASQTDGYSSMRYNWQSFCTKYMCCICRTSRLLNPTNVTASKYGTTLCRRKNEVRNTAAVHSLLGPNNHQSQLFQLPFNSFYSEACNIRATILAHLSLVHEHNFTIEFHTCALKTILNNSLTAQTYATWLSRLKIPSQ